MSFPPLHPSSQNSITSSDSKPSSAGSGRPRQSAWGLSAQPNSRRGLTPLSTNVGSTSDASAPRPDPISPSASAVAASPFAPTFSSVLNSATRNAAAASSTRHPSSSSSASPFPPLQAGSTTSSSQPPAASSSQPLSSPRSRTTTPFSGSNLASSAAGSAAASREGGGGGGSGGGGQPSARPGAFSPSLSTHSLTSPTATSFDRGAFGSSNQQSSLSGSSQSNVSKIVVAQVFLLLGSITEKEGKAKWNSQAEAIHKLVDSHGMEVYAKYLRRLLVGNAHIFAANNRTVETPGNYQLLVQEIEKASQDPEQAKRVAEVIDTSEGDIFRDFDLSTFLAHFKLHPLRKTILAESFTRVSKPDLRAKASSILTSTYPPFIQALGSTSPEHDLPPHVLATAAFVVLRNFSEGSRDGSEKLKVNEALGSRFAQLNVDMPPVIQSAMALAASFAIRHELADELANQGPAATSSVESAKDAIRRFGPNRVDEDEIASALLYLVLSQEADQYNPGALVSALRQIPSSINWGSVVRGFDRDGVVLTQSQFLSLYRALLPVAEDETDFDIQSLWGGDWQNDRTQLSFAINLVSLPASDLDASTIPDLRRAFEPGDCNDGPSELVTFAEEAAKDPLLSLDAVVPIGKAIWNPVTKLTEAEAKHVRLVIGAKMTLFICAASGIPKPWNELQEDFFNMRLRGCFMKTQADYRVILHLLWKQDKQWLARRLMEIHSQDPITLNILFEHILEHNWLEELCSILSGFAIDLAALAHRKGMLNFREWAEEKYTDSPTDVVNAFSKFLQIKAQDEIRLIRQEQPAACTVSLSIKTVNTILEFLEEHVKDKRAELNQLERQCMQAFPRLCNYGEGCDEVIEANGANTNILPVTADREMQDYYKRMYNGELEVRHIIEGLRDCKNSDDPGKQDLFACMIHGLFDEFVCFNEYPLGPLATTAVLFGGIVNYRLINNIALNIALEMVLESVREYGTDTSMYKFGLQALLHFQSRFTEWPEFCRRLVQIQGLQGTEPYAKAQEALREDDSHRNGETNGVHDFLDTQQLTNGTMDDFINADSLVPQFRSVNVDPVLHPEYYEEPTATIQDTLLFVLNNVTEQNLSVKISEITNVLEPKHYQWFASHLVEQRAKSQPNYQPLYLDLLGRINQKSLWADVLRETFIGVRRILNAVSTMKAPMERTHLKHLGTWLGLLTIARDKPIKHKNIAFKELLIEGWETSRLLLTIPFTCEVLAQGAKSTVFKPPNPWVMEVIGLLLELYDLPDLKIQQKFAVEVLLGTFGLPRNGEGIERSNELKKRQAFEESQEQMMQESLEPFDEMPIGSLNKGLRNARFTPPALQELENSITLPPSSNTSINQNQLRHIVATAVHRSITEIIGPVVERSVTIATISTKDLICKDYAQESSEERVREAFEQMAKSLSGSLAAVTCKEPMRMSMGNFIRMGAGELPEPLPEGSVLMCVNDNLEMACKIVEKQAAESAIPEIEPHVENEISKRRKHKAEFPNEPYRDTVASHWSTYIPEPYKQTVGGLNQQQLDIYQHFAPQVRGNHVATGSADSGKQIPDVLQEPSFPTIPNLPTPAEAPAVPQQPPPQQQPGRPLPTMANSLRSTQTNGYLDPPAMQDHIQELIAELGRTTEETPDQHFRNLNRDSPVLELFGRIVNLVRSSADVDHFTFFAAAFICPILYGNDSMPKFEVEVLVQLLKQMCHLSDNTLGKLVVYFRQQPDEKILNIPVTVALLEIGLLEFMAVDSIIAHGLHNQKTEALHVLSGLLDALLFGAEPVALRADFINSLSEMGQWLSTDGNLEPAKSIMTRLQAAGMPESIDAQVGGAQHRTEAQMQYIFSEWVTLFSQLGPSDKVLVGFIVQLHERKDLDPAENMIVFLRRSVDIAVESLERPDVDPALGPHVVFSTLDALANLIVLLVKHKDENPVDGEPKGTKASYMKSILSLVVLVMNNHHVMRGEHFNQKAFFRIFSMVFYGWYETMRGTDIKQDRSMIQALGEALLLLEPSNFPSFVYGWMSLVSHRIFMPAVLKIADNEGSDLFLNLIEIMLSYVGGLLKPEAFSGVAKELHRGVLRILLILHHDFPEFLADNHFRLCNTIPPHCTQLRNLVLSAFPSSILELPDPFANGLKVDRLDDIRKSPNVNGDIQTPLQHGHLKDIIDRALGSGGIQNEVVAQIISIVSSGPASAEDPEQNAAVDTTVLHAMVIYIGQSAISANASGFANSPSFNSDSLQIVLLSKLAKEFPPAARYHYLSAIANQLRYPNSHTHFFSFALLQLFGTDQNDQQESDVRQQITRILLERLIVHRPHPWGLIITLLELLKNPVYMFMELPFIKAAPEVGKIFHSFIDHLNQSSRQIA